MTVVGTVSSTYVYRIYVFTKTSFNVIQLFRDRVSKVLYDIRLFIYIQVIASVYSV